MPNAWWRADGCKPHVASAGYEREEALQMFDIVDADHGENSAGHCSLALLVCPANDMPHTAKSAKGCSWYRPIMSWVSVCGQEEEEEEFHQLLPASKADQHLCVQAPDPDSLKYDDVYNMNTEVAV